MDSTIVSCSRIGTSPSPCRVIIADDHPVVLSGIAKVLQPDENIKIVAMTQTVGQTLAALNKTVCDILICDYSFDEDPEPDGLALLRRIRRLHPDVKIILLSSHYDLMTIKATLNLGVQAFLRKSADLDTVLMAIRAARQSKRFTDEATADDLLKNMLDPQYPKSPAAVLSIREAETMRLLQKGLRVSEIAQMTHRSIKTVSAQKSALMRKLGARNDMELFKVLGTMT
ncbi:response regulator transcription factor [Pandoraea sp.]|uniref:response regulator transcription factor n=1 Tax=Pandoraea sp. TaxID=1883445 RepID=UPI0025FB016F|nr:response regulator transcription factor [Pandoraea sp.]